MLRWKIASLAHLNLRNMLMLISTNILDMVLDLTEKDLIQLVMRLEETY